MTGTITDEFRLKFDKACRLQTEGATDSALNILFELELSDSGPMAPVIGMIGQLLYYKKNDPEKALDYLFRSSKMSPKSERTSLALFHALFDLNRIDEAFDEMRRFMSLSDSREYRTLLSDLNRDE